MQSIVRGGDAAGCAGLLRRRVGHKRLGAFGTRRDKPPFVFEPERRDGRLFLVDVGCARVLRSGAGSERGHGRALLLARAVLAGG